MEAAWSGITNFSREDKEVVTWYEENAKAISEKLEQMKAETVSRGMAELMSNDKVAALRGLKELLHTIPVGEREEIMRYLK